jgi:hypothetical protein
MTETTNIGSSEQEATTNYKDKSNWTIDFFVNHTQKNST